MPFKALSLIVVLAAALWWGRGFVLERWPAALPGLDDFPSGPSTAARARKCTGPTGTRYTDGPCPAGSREQALDGGALTVLPRAPATVGAAGPDAAASALPPLRRLSGPALPDQHERQVEQALQR
jgi:hypothetical protein